MTVVPINVANNFLSGMESYYGVSSTNPSACLAAGQLASYIMTDMQGNTGQPSFAPIAITGTGMASSFGSTDQAVITFFDGVVNYLKTNFVGTASSGLTTPMIPGSAFDAGRATCSVDIADAEPLKILCSSLINELNNVTVIPTTPPGPIVIASIS